MLSSRLQRSNLLSLFFLLQQTILYSSQCTAVATNHPPLSSPQISNRATLSSSTSATYLQLVSCLALSTTIVYLLASSHRVLRSSVRSESGFSWFAFFFFFFFYIYIFLTLTVLICAGGLNLWIRSNCPPFESESQAILSFPRTSLLLCYKLYITLWRWYTLPVPITVSKPRCALRVHFSGGYHLFFQTYSITGALINYTSWVRSTNNSSCRISSILLTSSNSNSIPTTIISANRAFYQVSVLMICLQTLYPT